MTNVERVKLARETELMLRSQFNQGREITPEDEIQYYGVNGIILGDYVNPEGIEAYIDDEMFYEAVKDSYKHIDLTGKRKRDLERFIAKREKTAAWLRQKANGIYF